MAGTGKLIIVFREKSITLLCSKTATEDEYHLLLSWLWQIFHVHLAFKSWLVVQNYQVSGKPTRKVSLWVIILTMDTQPASSFRSLHEGTNDTKTQSFVGLILVTKFPRQLKE